MSRRRGREGVAIRAAQSTAVAGAILLTALSLAAPAAAHHASPSNGPGRTQEAKRAVSLNIALFYAFDNDTNNIVTDKSTHHIDGALVNATSSTAYVTGLPGKKKALKLVASSRQYVAVPENDALDVNRYTLAALVNYTGVETADTLDRWEVLEKAGAYWLNIRIDGHVRVGGFYGGCGNSQFWKFFDSTAVVPTNTWTAVAATYNGSKLTVYINGVAAGSMSITGTTCSNDEPLAIGAKNAPAKGLLEAFMDGQLDDVRIYNKALTADRVAALVP